MTDPEPMLDVARGDIGVSRQVGAALRVIAADSRDEALKRQIGEILAGRGSVRDLAGAEPFNRVLDRVIPAAMKKLSELPESERERLVEQGRADLERYRNSPHPTPVPDLATPARTATTADRSSGATPAERQPHNHPGGPERVIPGTRKPNREQIVGPDDDMDDDDRYFRDRRRRGWLQ